MLLFTPLTFETYKIDMKITLKWMHKKFVTTEYTSYYSINVGKEDNLH